MGTNYLIANLDTKEYFLPTELGEGRLNSLVSCEEYKTGAFLLMLMWHEWRGHRLEIVPLTTERAEYIMSHYSYVSPSQFL